MSCDNLTLYSSWASIISLIISVISLFLISGVKRSIQKYRRNQRIRALIDGIKTVPRDAEPLTGATRAKLNSLKNFVPARLVIWRFSEQGRAAKRLHDHIDSGKLDEIFESIEDWSSYLEGA